MPCVCKLNLSNSKFTIFLPWASKIETTERQNQFHRGFLSQNQLIALSDMLCCIKCDSALTEPCFPPDLLLPALAVAVVRSC